MVMPQKKLLVSILKMISIYLGKEAEKSMKSFSKCGSPRVVAAWEMTVFQSMRAKTAVSNTTIPRVEREQCDQICKKIAIYYQMNIELSI